ncbi:swim zinc finger domain-containing protein [Vibrio cholerae MZO-3]|nr:swim zinc finger domain-containing protein [Vibrio cholerae MZO-3]
MHRDSIGKVQFILSYLYSRKPNNFEMELPMPSHSSFLDISALFEQCEQSSLLKGAQLAKSGAVRKLTITGHTVNAEVKGSQLYRVQLTGGQASSSRCTCPAAGHQAVCKHAVAVALCLLDQQSQNEDGEREQIRRYLSTLSEEARLEMLLDYLERDKSVWQALLAKEQPKDQSLSYNELKKKITQALPRKQLWDWGDVSDYFAQAEEQLDWVFDVAMQLATDQQWKLIQHTVTRLNSVLEQIDDSNGERFGVEALINVQMPMILNRLEWSEEEKAQWMFERMTHHEFDVYPSIETDFAIVWRSNPTFLHLCRKAIENTPLNRENAWDLKTWAAPLLAMAADWHEVIAIKQKIAWRCDDFLDIVQLYLEHQEPHQAEFWLAKAKKHATPYEKQQCEQLQVNLYLCLGQMTQAWQLANRLFTENPSFDSYQKLSAFKTTHQIEDAEFLTRIEQSLIACYQPADARGFISRNSSDVVEFYIEQQAWQKACDWVANRTTESQVLLRLADHIIANQPQLSLQYYLRVARASIEQTSNQGYQNAIHHLQRIERLLAKKSHRVGRFLSRNHRSGRSLQT